MAGTPVDYDPFATAEGTPVEHDPFNVPKESVWEAVKAGAKQAFSPEAITEYGKEIPPAAAARMAAPVRMATGIARIPANLMRMAGIEEPAQAVKAAEAGAKNLTESAGYTGMRPGLSNLGGEMLLGGAALKGASKLAPVLEATPGGAAISKGIAESPSAQAILGGMGLGAAGSSGSTYDVLKEAGLGGLLGLGGQAVATGLGHVAAPVLKNYKELKNLGYTDTEILKNLSFGQLLGGKAQTAENVAANVPLGGVVPEVQSKIKALQETLKGKIEPIKAQSEAAQNVLGVSQNQAQTLEQRALQDAKDKIAREMTDRHSAEIAAHKTTGADVHIPVLNYVLEPLGAKVTPGLTGHAATNETKDFIKKAYNDSLSGMGTLKLPESAKTDMQNLTRNFDLGPYNQSFEKDIEHLINQTTNKNWLSPEKWQGNLSELASKAYKASTGGGGVFDANYGKALYQLKDKWMDLIEGQVGSDLFKAANTAFSRSKIPERAASYGKSIKSEGQVEPNELINAIRAELSTSRLAGGEDTIQKMAVEANKKYLADKSAIEAKHTAEKLAHQQGTTQQTRALEDKFTGMGQSLAAQKAALQKQAEGNIGKQEAAVENVIGAKNPEDYAAKRLGWQLGLGSMLGGGYGLSHLGIDPLISGSAGLGTVAATRFLYHPAVQNWLKQKAIATRSPMAKEIGETLKSNAPAVGLTATQIRQDVNQQEDYPQQGGLPVPK